MKNIFLTGDSGVGKTTIINQVLRETGIAAKGFRTVRVLKNQGEAAVFYLHPCGRKGLNERVIFASRETNEMMKVHPEVFDEAGVSFLNELEGADLVLMDELGFMENDAFLFQKKVMEVLAGELPVLGVIKERDTPFLAGIKALPDTVVFEITLENRDGFPELLKNMLSEACPKGSAVNE